MAPDLLAYTACSFIPNERKLYAILVRGAGWTYKQIYNVAYTIFFALNGAFWWLARPGGNALARQLFLGRGGSPILVQSWSEYHSTWQFARTKYTEYSTHGARALVNTICAACAA